MKGMNANDGRALSGIDHVKQSITDILQTPIGSRVMRRDYGSRLFQLIDNPQSAALDIELIAATADAIKKWEPRVEVTKVFVKHLVGSATIDLIGLYKPDGKMITLEGIEIK